MEVQHSKHLLARASTLTYVQPWQDAAGVPVVGCALSDELQLLNSEPLSLVMVFHPVRGLWSKINVGVDRIGPWSFKLPSHRALSVLVPVPCKIRSPCFSVNRAGIPASSLAATRPVPLSESNYFLSPMFYNGAEWSSFLETSVSNIQMPQVNARPKSRKAFQQSR